MSGLQHGSGHAAGVQVMPTTAPLPAGIEACLRMAAEVGYPQMLQASWG